MTSWSDEPLHRHGVSGDLDWIGGSEPPLAGPQSILLTVATVAYFGSVWLLSGLAPLPLLASRVRPMRHKTSLSHVDTQSSSSNTWSDTPA
jgi:hypothetical protein